MSCWNGVPACLFGSIHFKPPAPETIQIRTVRWKCCVQNHSKGKSKNGRTGVKICNLCHQLCMCCSCCHPGTQIIPWPWTLVQLPMVLQQIFSTPFLSLKISSLTQFLSIDCWKIYLALENKFVCPSVYDSIILLKQLSCLLGGYIHPRLTNTRYYKQIQIKTQFIDKYKCINKHKQTFM